MKIREEIYTILRELRVPTYVRGHQYIACALEYLLEVPQIGAVNYTRDMYPYIAHQCRTNTGAMERSMRVAIGMTWPHIPHETMMQVGLKGKPTNKNFLSTVATYIRYIQKREKKEAAET